MGLSDIESTLPPGFRFCPSDEELIFYYLYMKVINGTASEGTLVEVDLHTTEPWELPVATKFNEKEHYFFAFRDRKYSTGFRTNRGTKSGYWKATGKDRILQDPSKPALIGMRKTLVFYGGRAPNGSKSGWVMHEYRLENPHVPPAEGWVLCRVFHKTKGETMRHDGQGNAQDNIDGSSSFSVASSIPPHRVDQGSADGHEQQPATNANGYREGNPWSPYGSLNMAEWPYGLLAQELDSTPDLRDGGEEFRLFLNMEGP